jgi:hypothetical protein
MAAFRAFLLSHGGGSTREPSLQLAERGIPLRRDDRREAPASTGRMTRSRRSCE